MKLSLKKIAAAVVLAATAASASADIQTVTNNTEMWLSMWDENGSYTLSLNKTYPTFMSAVAADGLLDLSFSLSSDSNFTSFLANVTDTSKVQWNVMSNDLSGVRNMAVSYSVMPDSTQPSDVIRGANTAGVLNEYYKAVNVAMDNASDSVFVTKTSPAYAGSALYGSTFDATYNFSTVGTLATNSYASGLNIMTLTALASSTEPSTYTQILDNGNAVRLYVADGALHIQAMPVPEPESYAMLLAGLGMVGFMARRRLGKRA